MPQPRPSRILPVIDLKRGHVVRGVAGRRELYEPVQSRIVDDTRPREVAEVFARLFDFSAVYVADLDAIGGTGLDMANLHEISNSGMRLLVDAGIPDATRAASVAESMRDLLPIEGIIVGLESVVAPEELARIAGQLDPQLAVFSLDLKDGATLANDANWSGRDALDIANLAVESGFRRLIVLDLAAVGVDHGPSVTDLCCSIRQKHAGIELISGGGVRHLDDVRALLAAGCDRVLVASALHDARITPREVRTL